MMADVSRADALAELFDYAMLREGPVLVLGEGSNLLFAGDHPGVVICLAMAGMRVLSDDGATVLVRADAGVNWNDFVRWTIGKGLAGLENMALIPGTVGACPIQNIGAYGVEVREFIETVEAYHRGTQQLKRIPNADCEFGYRDSMFKASLEDWTITAVEFRLPRERELRLDYAGVKEELAAMGVVEPFRPSHVAEAISRIRTRKLPNPALIGNAGSFFKNPIVPLAQADALKEAHPALPVFGSDPLERKLSAAWLLEQAGWKGYREGDAGISAQHSLVLVNHGHATGMQLLDLARKVASSIHAKYGVLLEPEPRIIGAQWAA
jgi:UDP-N-acetylmuramate dehydrogenase